MHFLSLFNYQIRHIEGKKNLADALLQRPDHRSEEEMETKAKIMIPESVWFTKLWNTKINGEYLHITESTIIGTALGDSIKHTYKQQLAKEELKEIEQTCPDWKLNYKIVNGLYYY